MNNKSLNQTLIFLLTILCISQFNKAQSILDKEYSFTGERTKEDQYFIMETKFTNYSLNGEITSYDIFKLHLKCSPLENDAYKYTCKKFIIKKGDSQEVSIPALENWSYIFDKASHGIDENGYVFGIDHEKFENLNDNFGQPIPPGETYLIYNAFIDFHGFCNAFAEPTIDGQGIQNLNKINQTIVHEAANSKPPVNLGKNIKEESYYQNGEITLSFTGLSKVNDADCAIVHFDSGEGSFKMIMTPLPNMEITTVGASHYKGDIYINTETFWVEKVIMDEFVLSETTLPAAPHKINSVIERNVFISNVTKENFNND